MVNKHEITLTGWWFQSTPLKNHGVKVSWDDDIPNWMESHNPFMFQTTNQLFLNFLKYIEMSIEMLKDMRHRHAMFGHLLNSKRCWDIHDIHRPQWCAPSNRKSMEIGYPLVNIRNREFTHWKWWFSLCKRLPEGNTYSIQADRGASNLQGPSRLWRGHVWRMGQRLSHDGSMVLLY